MLKARVRPFVLGFEEQDIILEVLHEVADRAGNFLMFVRRERDDGLERRSDHRNRVSALLSMHLRRSTQ